MIMPRYLLPPLAALAVAACGGGSGSTANQGAAGSGQPPPAAAPVTIVGPVSGFGSVYVNGVRFDTSGAAYRIDDDDAFDDRSLSVGMVVTVKGSVDPEGTSGEADEIYYDDDIEGIVSGLTADPDDSSVKTFQIWGLTVRIEDGLTHFDMDDDDDGSFGFETVVDGDVVEVSGEYADGLLIASYVELQDELDDDVEAKGVVDQYDGMASFVLVLRNGASLSISLAPGAEIPDAGIQDGQYVEVEGTIPDPANAPDELLAVEVELEDDDFLDDDDDDVEIRGSLSFDDGVGAWFVRGTELSFDAGTDYQDAGLQEAIADGSAAGLYVEVEGDFSDGVLTVDEIEVEGDLDEDNEVEFEGVVQSVEASAQKEGEITLSFGNATGVVTIRVSPSTFFMDDDANSQFDLAELPIGGTVEIEGRLADDDGIDAVSLEREDDNEFEIKGPVSAVDATSITILGVTFGIDAATEFEDGVPSVGDRAEVEDENADGVADIIEIED